MIRWRLMRPITATALLACITAGETGAQDRTSVRGIPASFSSIKVLTQDGTRLEAERFCISADTVTFITAMGVRYSYLKPSVTSVSFSQGNRSRLGGAVGAIIGISAGLAICAAIGDYNVMEDGNSGVNSSVLMPIGGVLGWLIGSHREKTIDSFDAQSFWDEANHLRNIDCR